MFGVLGKVAGYIFGASSDDEEDTDVSTEGLPVLKDEVKEFIGHVTSVHSGYGLINSEICFTQDVVYGRVIPQVGQKVKVIAKRKHGAGGWRAQEVIPQLEDKTESTENWDEENEEGNNAQEDSSVSPNEEDNVTMVTAITDDGGILGNINSFDLEECVDGFIPCVGDWVQADLVNDGTCSSPQAKQIRPLRQREFEGHVTGVQSTCGYIEKEIYFQRSVCEDDFIPRKWDRVRGRAVESSTRGGCTWRAIEVTKIEDKKLPLIRSSTLFNSPSTDGSGDFHDALQSRSLYMTESSTKRNMERYHSTQQVKSSWLVPGQRPVRARANISFPNRLGQYPVREELEDSVLNNSDLTEVAPVLSEELCVRNYSSKFTALLHLEEIQEEIDIRQFDLERICMRPVGGFLALPVPGLAEGRPSVLIGDRVILSEPGLPGFGPEYEGYVHEVLKDEVLLKFHGEFHSSYHGEDYNVRFKFNRTTLRRCHQAAEFAQRHLGSEVLFPENIMPKTPQSKLWSPSQRVPQGGVMKASPVKGIKKCPLGSSMKTTSSPQHKFFNQTLNPRQKAAVLRILKGQSRPSPYILFGPPGTGKTITVVEAILQILHNVQSSRIIACTPSNSAADLLTVRLHESGQVKKSDLVRLNAFQRNEESIANSIRAYCADANRLDFVARHRILVCTCATAGCLFSINLRPGHFTHVFVDEAGQATEPECVIPVGLVAGDNGQVVLAGDPMQLGPVLMSGHTKQYGLNMSFLERLINMPLYERNEDKFADNGCYDPLLVTKLVENYRSHPTLLALPSELFYNDELEVSADKHLIECLCQWEKLPTQGVPLIFHGLRGEDLRDGDSPSWFNPVEAVQVMKYLQALVTNPIHKLTFDDIGIITPYRKQVEKIRMLIDKLGMERVKVGSVEEFQGQERLVIIISPVRSNDSLIGTDARHHLGFLSNPKRFNVAITRAQALLIIMGNPYVLVKDPYWEALLQYSVVHGAYTGCELPPSLHLKTEGVDVTQGDSVEPNTEEGKTATDELPEDVAADVNNKPQDSPQPSENSSDVDMTEIRSENILEDSSVCDVDKATSEDSHNDSTIGSDLNGNAIRLPMVESTTVKPITEYSDRLEQNSSTVVNQEKPQHSCELNTSTSIEDDISNTALDEVANPITNDGTDETDLEGDCRFRDVTALKRKLNDDVKKECSVILPTSADSSVLSTGDKNNLDATREVEQTELECYPSAEKMSPSEDAEVTASSSTDSLQPEISRDEWIWCLISFIESPDKFWIHIVNDYFAWTVNELRVKLKDYESSLSDLDVKGGPFDVEDACCAVFPGDNELYRGIVKKVHYGYDGEWGPPEYYLIHYIDFGNTDWVHAFHVYASPDELKSWPPQAFCCSLAECQPLPYRITSSSSASISDWSAEAVTAFKNLTGFENPLRAYIIQDDSNDTILWPAEDQLFRVILVNVSASPATWIAQELVTQGYASLTYVPGVKRDGLNRCDNDVISSDPPRDVSDRPNSVSLQDTTDSKLFSNTDDPFKIQEFGAGCMVERSYSPGVDKPEPNDFMTSNHSDIGCNNGVQENFERHPIARLPGTATIGSGNSHLKVEPTLRVNKNKDLSPRQSVADRFLDKHITPVLESRSDHSRDSFTEHQSNDKENKKTKDCITAEMQSTRGRTNTERIRTKSETLDSVTRNYRSQDSRKDEFFSGNQKRKPTGRGSYSTSTNDHFKHCKALARRHSYHNDVALFTRSIAHSDGATLNQNRYDENEPCPTFPCHKRSGSGDSRFAHVIKHASDPHVDGYTVRNQTGFIDFDTKCNDRSDKQSEQFIFDTRDGRRSLPVDNRYRRKCSLDYENSDFTGRMKSMYRRDRSCPPRLDRKVEVSNSCSSNISIKSCKSSSTSSGKVSAQSDSGQDRNLHQIESEGSSNNNLGQTLLLDRAFPHHKQVSEVHAAKEVITGSSQETVESHSEGDVQPETEPSANATTCQDVVFSSDPSQIGPALYLEAIHALKKPNAENNLTMPNIYTRGASKSGKRKSKPKESSQSGETDIIHRARGDKSLQYEGASSERYTHCNSPLTARDDDLALNQTTELEKKIIKQIEYYFGDSNLIKDKFLLRQIARDPEGWVPLELLVTFKRLQALSKDFTVITGALAKSQAGIIQISEDGQKIRRSKANPQIKNVDRWKSGAGVRSIVVSGLPRDIDIDLPLQYFESFGEVEHIERNIQNELHERDGFLTLVMFKSTSGVASIMEKADMLRLGNSVLTVLPRGLVYKCVDYYFWRRIKGVASYKLRFNYKQRKSDSSSNSSLDRRSPTLRYDHHEGNLRNCDRLGNQVDVTAMASKPKNVCDTGSEQPYKGALGRGFTEPKHNLPSNTVDDIFIPLQTKNDFRFGRINRKKSSETVGEDSKDLQDDTEMKKITHIETNEFKNTNKSYGDVRAKTDKKTPLVTTAISSVLDKTVMMPADPSAQKVTSQWPRSTQVEEVVQSISGSVISPLTRTTLPRPVGRGIRSVSGIGLSYSRSPRLPMQAGRGVGSGLNRPFTLKSKNLNDQEKSLTLVNSPPLSLKLGQGDFDQPGGTNNIRPADGNNSCRMFLQRTIFNDQVDKPQEVNREAPSAVSGAYHDESADDVLISNDQSRRIATITDDTLKITVLGENRASPQNAGPTCKSPPTTTRLETALSRDSSSSSSDSWSDTDTASDDEDSETEPCQITQQRKHIHLAGCVAKAIDFGSVSSTALDEKQTCVSPVTTYPASQKCDAFRTGHEPDIKTKDDPTDPEEGLVDKPRSKTPEITNISPHTSPISHITDRSSTGQASDNAEKHTYEGYRSAQLSQSAKGLNKTNNSDLYTSGVQDGTGYGDRDVMSPALHPERSRSVSPAQYPAHGFYAKSYSLEQTDSDVIVESSEEEYIEDSST